MELPVAKAVTSIVRKVASRPMTAVPMLGGSVPMSLIGDTLLVPVIGVPMVNYDNNQHAANENLRLQNLWDGIEIYGALLAELNW
jgi:acetylornithine deacetylase/succinyl-diaminopimelate desuccinylase-like protein